MQLGCRIGRAKGVAPLLQTQKTGAGNAFFINKEHRSSSHVKQLPQITILRPEPSEGSRWRPIWHQRIVCFATIGIVLWHHRLDKDPFPLAPLMSPRLINPPWFVARRRWARVCFKVVAALDLRFLFSSRLLRHSYSPSSPVKFYQPTTAPLFSRAFVSGYIDFHVLPFVISTISKGGSIQICKHEGCYNCCWFSRHCRCWTCAQACS